MSANGRNAGSGTRTFALLLRSTGPVVLAIGAGLLLAALFAASMGASVGEFFSRLFAGTLGSAYGVSQVLFKATPLIFTGLSVAIAFQARLFNIGAEGQMVLGGLGMAWAGATFPILPFPFGLVEALIVGAAVGALWGAIPGLLRARTGSHEVIVTIMLNFVALALANYLLSARLALPESVRTADIAAGAALPRFSDAWSALAGSPLNAAFPLALLAAAGVYVWSRRTPIGFSLQVLGEGPLQAHYAGLPIARLTVFAMSLSGAFAGLAGSSFVLGYKHYYEEGFSGGAGFQGIAVALLARNHPLYVVPSAIFFGFLSYGGLVANSVVPRELLDVIQATILLLFIVADRLCRRWSDRLLDRAGLAELGEAVEA